jgi:lysophospholipase L1-like esterase
MGYDKYVKMALEGEADVVYPRENCRFTGYITRHLVNWRADFKLGEDVDLVHWNVGLWDALILEDGEHRVPLEIFEYYFERICKQIRSFFPRAKVIFATSTPVQEHLFTGPIRKNADIRRYNERATEIAKRYGARINDLYSLVDGCPASYYSDKTHLYTKDGTRLLTERVADVIAEELGVTRKPLDYDALFAETTEVVGI